MEWDEAIDKQVEEILTRLFVEEPPVDALQTAKLLGCELAYDNTQGGRARQKLLEGQPAVFLRPDKRPERLQWATAHELGEIMAWQIYREVEAGAEELPHQFREQLANRFASRFLLPNEWFQTDYRTMGRDLFLLKERYQTASHELIARRLQDLDPEMILTIIDRGNISTRTNGYSGRPGPLTSEEREAIRECHESGRALQFETDHLRIEAWPIHEPDWKREILFTLPAHRETPSETPINYSFC